MKPNDSLGQFQAEFSIDHKRIDRDPCGRPHRSGLLWGVLMRRNRIAPTLAFASLMAFWQLGCADTEPSGLPEPSAEPPSSPQFAISDGVHSDGNPNFFFLPPLVWPPHSSPHFDPDGFDATLLEDIEVIICEADENGCLPDASQPEGFPRVFTSDTGEW